MRLILFIIIFLSIGLDSAWSQCETDCVWPGDLNANGIANNLDALAFGFALGQTGPARVAASTNWEGQSAEEWSGSLPFLGTNFKHADADGDGIVEPEDQFPISVNYNQTNDLFTGLLGNNIEGNDLFVVPQNTVTSPGGSLILDIHLGSEAEPIENMYGIGFQLKMDTQYVETVNVDFSESWLGFDEEIFTYSKFSDEVDHAGIAITRVDGNALNGFGKIARVEIVITDVILGIAVDSTACLPFIIEFVNVLGINANEEDLSISAQSDSLELKHPSQLTTPTRDLQSSLQDFHLFPNPSSGIIYLSNLQNIEAESIRLLNGNGQKVYEAMLPRPSTREYQLSISRSLPRGLYFLELQTKAQRIRKKLILQ